MSKMTKRNQYYRWFLRFIIWESDYARCCDKTGGIVPKRYLKYIELIARQMVQTSSLQKWQVWSKDYLGGFICYLPALMLLATSLRAMTTATVTSSATPAWKLWWCAAKVFWDATDKKLTSVSFLLSHYTLRHLRGFCPLFLFWFFPAKFQSFFPVS